MKAVRMHQFGGPETLQIEDVPDPKPASGEILIDVSATSINPVDWKMREGWLVSMYEHPLPFIPGWDVAGTILETGDNVSGFAVGQEVFGLTNFGAGGCYAERVIATAADLALAPSSVPLHYAAALPTAGGTAWQSLFAPEYGGLQAGETVLIHGGAGGIGSFAVQLAKWKGAHVIATASGHNVDFVRSLGANQVIDYKSAAFEDLVADVDLVVDLIGGEVETRSLSVIRDGGRFVSTVNLCQSAEAAERNIRTAMTLGAGGPQVLAALSDLVDNGALKIEISEISPLEAAGDAQERNRAGHARGKALLQPGAA